jgi:hypothetical protein
MTRQLARPAHDRSVAIGIARPGPVGTTASHTNTTVAKLGELPRNHAGAFGRFHHGGAAIDLCRFRGGVPGAAFARAPWFTSLSNRDARSTATFALLGGATL